MMKIISRWALLAYLWKNHHFSIRLLSVCAVLSVLIIVLHSEYIAYCNISDAKTCNTALSYFLKWGSVLAISLVAFALLRYRAPKQVSTSQNDLNNPNLAHSPIGDGFDSIRNKTTLASRGDLIIRSKQNR